MNMAVPGTDTYTMDHALAVNNSESCNETTANSFDDEHLEIYQVSPRLEGDIEESFDSAIRNQIKLYSDITANK